MGYFSDKMIIEDGVYGKFEVTEPVLAELIESAPVQRLRRIGQAGASKYVFPNRDVTRYEHSVGVMLLLRMLGASVEEQIAGLLHDVCHTAFSHVVDVVYSNEENDYHERFKEKVIYQSEIPLILKKYGYNTGDILDERRFGLLERKIPELCADRIDYSLRDFLRFYGNKRRIGRLVKSLRAKGGGIVFADEIAAEDFAFLFLELDERIYANPLECAFYFVLADALKIALSERIISEQDFFSDDEVVMRKLRESQKPKIMERLALLRSDLRIEISPKGYDYFVKPKIRYVDPGFIAKKGGIRRVSEVSQKFAKRLEGHREAVKEGYHIRILG